MSKLFIVNQGKVKYPTWCPSGIILKEVDGKREYPVVDMLLEKVLLNKIGKRVEENIDFEVIQRKIGNGNSSCRTALLCDKGEIAGGELRRGKWYITVMEEDKTGKQREYLAEDLIPIQHAQRVESNVYIENIKWRKIKDDFHQASDGLKTSEQITDWFRNKLSE